MHQFIAFAHGMANFAHNRGTKQDQEQLIRRHLEARHSFLGAYDDSGNFAFITQRDMKQLQIDVLFALNTRYRVTGIVVIEKDRTARALSAIETLCKDQYGPRFQAWDYTVWKEDQRWRVGLVFVEPQIGFSSYRSHDPDVEILTITEGVIGVLKFDPKHPRIPWGVPAKMVETLVAARVLATGRSARTVRGVLERFS